MSGDGFDDECFACNSLGETCPKHRKGAKPGPWAIYPMRNRMDPDLAPEFEYYVTREKVAGAKDQESFGPFDEGDADRLLAYLKTGEAFEKTDDAVGELLSFIEEVVLAKQRIHEGDFDRAAALSQKYGLSNQHTPEARRAAGRIA